MLVADPPSPVDAARSEYKAYIDRFYQERPWGIIWFPRYCVVAGDPEYAVVALVSADPSLFDWERMRAELNGLEESEDGQRKRWDGDFSRGLLRSPRGVSPRISLEMVIEAMARNKRARSTLVACEAPLWSVLPAYDGEEPCPQCRRWSLSPLGYCGWCGWTSTRAQALYIVRCSNCTFLVAREDQGVTADEEGALYCYGCSTSCTRELPGSRTRRLTNLAERDRGE